MKGAGDHHPQHDGDRRGHSGATSSFNQSRTDQVLVQSLHPLQETTARSSRALVHWRVGSPRPSEKRPGMADAHLSPNSSKVATSTTAARPARSGWRPRPASFAQSKIEIQQRIHTKSGKLADVTRFCGGVASSDVVERCRVRGMERDNCRRGDEPVEQHGYPRCRALRVAAAIEQFPCHKATQCLDWIHHTHGPRLCNDPLLVRKRFTDDTCSRATQSAAGPQARRL